MSLAALKEKIKSDSVFAEKFNGIETVDEMVEIAAENGFDLTMEEIEDLSAVSQEELGKVAGGTSRLSPHVRVSLPLSVIIA